MVVQYKLYYVRKTARLERRAANRVKIVLSDCWLQVPHLNFLMSVLFPSQMLSVCSMQHFWKQFLSSMDFNLNISGMRIHSNIGFLFSNSNISGAIFSNFFHFFHFSDKEELLSWSSMIFWFPWLCN